eukprot:965086-Pleurochrysis_carterae.AAC.1
MSPWTTKPSPKACERRRRVRKGRGVLRACVCVPRGGRAWKRAAERATEADGERGEPKREREGRGRQRYRCARRERTTSSIQVSSTADPNSSIEDREPSTANTNSSPVKRLVNIKGTESSAHASLDATASVGAVALRVGACGRMCVSA